VGAVAVNPVDYKVANGTVPEAGGIKVIGYDAAGVVVEVGRETRLFNPGDEVLYTGSMGRKGANAEYRFVDERIVGRKAALARFPAAVLPLTSIAAWELEAPHGFLNEVADLVESRRARSTMSENYGRIDAANLMRAMGFLKSGRAIGKIVLSGF
jgi:hypothetical protein